MINRKKTASKIAHLNSHRKNNRDEFLKCLSQNTKEFEN